MSTYTEFGLGLRFARLIPERLIFRPKKSIGLQYRLSVYNKICSVRHSKCTCPPPELKHCDVYLKQIGPMRRSYRENPISAFQCPRRELQA